MRQWPAAAGVVGVDETAHLLDPLELSQVLLAELRKYAGLYCDGVAMPALSWVELRRNDNGCTGLIRDAAAVTSREGEGVQQQC